MRGLDGGSRSRLVLVQSSRELGASRDARIPREAQAGGFEQERALDGLELYPCYAQPPKGSKQLLRDAAICLC